MLAQAVQGGVHVGKVGVVFGMFVHPAGNQRFHGIHGLAGSPLGIGGTEIAAHIGLAWLHQHGGKAVPDL